MKFSRLALAHSRASRGFFFWFLFLWIRDDEFLLILAPFFGHFNYYYFIFLGGGWLGCRLAALLALFAVNYHVLLCLVCVGSIG